MMEGKPGQEREREERTQENRDEVTQFIGEGVRGGEREEQQNNRWDGPGRRERTPPQNNRGEV